MTAEEITKEPPEEITKEPPKKTTKAQKQQRVALVYEFLLNAAPRSEIVKYCLDTWGVSATTADNYIKAARVLLDEYSNEVRDRAYNMALMRREAIYHKAAKSGDWRLALDVERETAKLLGLDKPKKVESNVTITNDERLKNIQSLLDAGRKRSD